MRLFFYHIASAKLRQRLLALALLLWGVSQSHSDTLTSTLTSTLASSLDWVPWQALNSEQQAALAPGSCGAYIAPIRSDDEANLNPADAPLRADAQQAITEDNPIIGNTATDQKKIVLIGDVVITQGYRQLKAQRAEWDKGAGLMTMSGDIEIREPDLLILGDRSNINQNDNSATVSGASFVNHSAAIRGQAKQFTRNGDNTVELLDARFTHCEPGNTGWALQGSRIYLDHDKRQGHVYHARLVAGGLPIFYSPYLRFPLGNQRMTGFLYPSFSVESDNSTISTPFYINLAPNYDWLVTPHMLERHGVLYENHFRHLSRHFYTQLNTAYLTDDKGKLDDDDQNRVDTGAITEAQAVPFKGEDRWLIHLDQEGKGQGWSSKINYTDVSDINYFRDFNFNTIAGQNDTFLDQKITTRFQRQDWNFEINSIAYETLSDSLTLPYEQLPAISASGQYDFGLWSLSLNHEWIQFDHPDANAAQPKLVGDRLRLDYRLGLDIEPEWGFFRPALQTKHLQYQLESDNFAPTADDQINISVPQFTLDSGLFFEREGKGYLQTFEPRLFYFYSDFEDHSALFNLTNDGQDVDFDTSELTFSYSQLFRDTRFSGGDRIDDADQLAIGLTTRFFGNESGLEWFSTSLGQITYFADRRVSLDNTPALAEQSNIALQFSANPSSALRFSGNALFDEQDNEVEQWNLASRYQGPKKHLAEVNYRFTRGSSVDNREIRASMIAPLFNDRWHLLVYTAWDIEQDRELDSISAIEYNGCCVRVRFGYRSELDNSLAGIVADDDLDYDYSAFFELHFKGLGGNSQALDSTLGEKIDGYADWQAIYHTK